MKKLLFLTIVSLLAGGAAGCSTCGEGCSLTRLFNRDRECGCHSCNHCGEGCSSCGSFETGSGCGCSSCGGGEFGAGEPTIISPTPAVQKPGTVIPGPDSYSFMSNK
jgi:hypothetical protein